MNNQSLILIAIGSFVALIVGVAAIDEYLLTEHPASEVSGLIWRVESAFSRVRDLEAGLELTQNGDPDTVVRANLRMVNGVPPVLSIRYRYPASLENEIIVVQNDQLAHYRPQEGLIVVKRWDGVPLSAVGLASLDISHLRRDWEAGRIEINLLPNVPGFSSDLFSTILLLSETISGQVCILPDSFCPTDVGSAAGDGLGFSEVADSAIASLIPGSYILEVRDAKSGELSRMIWIDRDTYFVQKVVFFAGGQRTSTLEVQWSETDQGLTADEILTLPRVDTIYG